MVSAKHHNVEGGGVGISSALAEGAVAIPSQAGMCRSFAATSAAISPPNRADQDHCFLISDRASLPSMLGLARGPTRPDSGPVLPQTP